MEHMIEHETLPLKEEKQLIRQIKQLKQNREELSSTMGKQDQSQQSLDHKDSIEENLKVLKSDCFYYISWINYLYPKHIKYV